MVNYWVAQIRRGFARVDVLRAVVFLVMLLGIADTLASGVVQRTRDLDTASAVGVRRWYLQRMVLVEALVMGALGLVLGGMVGIALGPVDPLDLPLPAGLRAGFSPPLHAARPHRAHDRPGVRDRGDPSRARRGPARAGGRSPLRVRS